MRGELDLIESQGGSAPRFGTGAEGKEWLGASQSPYVPIVLIWQGHAKVLVPYLSNENGTTKAG